MRVHVSASQYTWQSSCGGQRITSRLVFTFHLVLFTCVIRPAGPRAPGSILFVSPISHRNIGIMNSTPASAHR